jgi:hypothetical protein
MNNNEPRETAKLFHDLEAGAQKLIIACAESGNYEIIARLIPLAQQIRDLAAVREERGYGRVFQAGAADGDDAGNKVVSSATAAPATEAVAGDSRPAPYSTRRGNVKPEHRYPLFYRSRSGLVKIGWSKKKKAEYRQTAPWEAVQAVVRAIEQRGGSGEKFDFGELLPVRAENGNEVPKYQAYVVLAWLRQVNLVTQHGRRGYSLPKAGKLSDLAADLLERVPAER